MRCAGRRRDSIDPAQKEDALTRIRSDQSGYCFLSSAFTGSCPRQKSFLTVSLKAKALDTDQI
jgi:hypothetical protein